MTQPETAPPPAGRLFCFGLGASAMALIERLKGKGWHFGGTVRKEAKRAALAAAGVDAALFDSGHAVEAAAERLAGTTHLLSSVPPDAEGDPVLRHHRHAVQAMRGLRWVGYLSTTGVYGDRGGGWVDEGSELRPTGRRGRLRVTAERAWLELQETAGVPVHIFRLAGIYGPSRNPLAAVREGRAQRVGKPGQVFSRIHVEDIAETLLRSIAAPKPGRIYNVCDDRPAPPEEVIAFAASLLGVPAPPLVAFEEARLSDMARSFYADNKRVRNDRIKRELGVTLRYPDYEAGLRALFAELRLK